MAEAMRKMREAVFQPLKGNDGRAAAKPRLI